LGFQNVWDEKIQKFPHGSRGSTELEASRNMYVQACSSISIQS
jgi:hypothetical protein